MKFYATKYWSTEGIVEFEGEVYENDGRKYASQLDRSGGHLFLSLGTDAFTDLKEAQENVEKKAHLNVHSKERAFVKAGKLLQLAIEKKIKVVKR
jgi:hypothetical protein